MILTGLWGIVAASTVSVSGSLGVRDYMLRYMAEIFVGSPFGSLAGQVAGWIVSGVFGFLLLSAVNTAIVDLIAISFLMSRDHELCGEYYPQPGLLYRTTLDRLEEICTPKRRLNR